MRLVWEMKIKEFLLIDVGARIEQCGILALNLVGLLSL